MCYTWFASYVETSERHLNSADIIELSLSWKNARYVFKATFENGTDEMTEHRHSPNTSGGHKFIKKEKLKLVIILTGTMMLAEFIGGLLTNSLALLSDAFHMLTHFFALLLTLVAIIIASKPTDVTKSYGLYRAEVIAALFNGIILMMITGYIFYEGYRRFLVPAPIAELEMLAIAFAGLIVNLVSAMVLSGTVKEDLNVKSAFYHMLGDTISSVGVITGGIIIFYTKWFIVDAIVSILIGAIILFWVFKLLVSSINILLESTPKHIKIEDVINAIKNIAPEIKDVHDLHIWEITSNMYSMTAHVVIKDMQISRGSELLAKITDMLDKNFNINHATIQFECAENCECIFT